MYYNTLNETQPELGLAWSQTQAQDEVIKKIFACYPNGLTPYEVLIKYESHGFKAPQTSIRRSISDLTKAGFLEMTTDKRKGQYKAMNFVWRKKK